MMPYLITENCEPSNVTVYRAEVWLGLACSGALGLFPVPGSELIGRTLGISSKLSTGSPKQTA